MDTLYNISSLKLSDKHPRQTAVNNTQSVSADTKQEYLLISFSLLPTARCSPLDSVIRPTVGRGNRVRKSWLLHNE